MDNEKTAHPHDCVTALVTERLHGGGEERFLINASDDIAEFENRPEITETRRFNFCPTCGKPTDWVAIATKGRANDENPRIRVLDAVDGAKPLPVVNVMVEADGSLLMIGDDFSLQQVEPYVAPETEETNEAG